MRFVPIIPAALILSLSQPAFAQDWTRFVSPEDGFSSNYPGKPKVETTTYTSEYRQQLPAKVYTAADALGRYSTTVVDYRGSEKMHADRAAKCQAAKGANQQDGDTCNNNFRVDVAGATDHAVWSYIKRDGVKMTHYMFYFVELVSGRLLQMTNADKTRTYAAIHQHAGRLYIHEATVPAGHARADPVHAVAGLGRRQGPGDSLSDHLYRRVRRVEVSHTSPAVHRPRSRHVH